MQIPLFLSTCICIFNKHVFNFNTIFENNFTLALSTKKSLKTSKGQPETVNRRRTDNTMAKKRKDKMTSNMIYKTLKIES